MCVCVLLSYTLKATLRVVECEPVGLVGVIVLQHAQCIVNVDDCIAAEDVEPGLCCVVLCCVVLCVVLCGVVWCCFVLFCVVLCCVVVCCVVTTTGHEAA